MDRNSIIGLILIGALLMTWSYFFAPNPQNNNPITSADSSLIQQKTTFIDTIKTTINEKNTLDYAFASQFWIFQKFAFGETKKVVVNTDLYEIQFSNKGGIPVQILSKKYKTYEEKPLPLLDNHSDNLFSYQFLHNQRVIKTQDLYFEPSVQDLKVSGKEKKELIFTAKIDDKKSLTLKYIFYGDSYHIDHELITSNLGHEIKNNYFELD